MPTDKPLSATLAELEAFIKQFPPGQPHPPLDNAVFRALPELMAAARDVPRLLVIEEECNIVGKDLVAAEKERDEAKTRAGNAESIIREAICVFWPLGDCPHETWSGSFIDLCKDVQSQRDAAIARAEAERDRCARIALAHKSKVTINEPLWHDGQDWAAQRIYDAIVGDAEPPPLLDQFGSNGYSVIKTEEIDALRARIEALEKERDELRDDCRMNAETAKNLNTEWGAAIARAEQAEAALRAALAGGAALPLEAVYSSEFLQIVRPHKLARTIEDYWRSIGDRDNKDFFSLGYQWADKPHRHVYDLIGYALYIENALHAAEGWRDELEQLRAANKQLASAAILPDGWRLVPVEPTDAMVEAGGSKIGLPGVYMGGADTHEPIRSGLVYRAMIDAAPSPETSNG